MNETTRITKRARFATLADALAFVGANTIEGQVVTVHVSTAGEIRNLGDSTPRAMGYNVEVTREER